MEKLLTLKETAKILRVSERTIMRYLKAGKLKASKVGQWRIKESDLEIFLKENSNAKRKQKK
jgi:excisionase family DNA binding protein